MSTRRPTQAELEASVVRFRDLAKWKSPFRPKDTLLERFDRERYSVIGRPAEGGTTRSSAEVKAFSVVYLRCEAGKGLAAHAHASSEVFIVMSGRWELDVQGTKTVLEPFDVVSVTPNAMHSARNISEGLAFMMTINEGQTGAPIKFDPAILEELRAAGHQVPDLEYPPGPRG